MSEPKQFYDGYGLTTDIGEAVRKMRELESTVHLIRLTESDRQTILLALAELSIARPGWVEMLSDIALKMDNKTAVGPQLFEDFRQLHVQPLVDAMKNS